MIPEVETKYRDYNPALRDSRLFSPPAPTLAQQLFSRLVGEPRVAQVITQAVEYVRGMDASRWNTLTNPGAGYQAGLRFAIFKATEGTGWVDPTFTDNWKRYLDAGYILGAYAFFRSNYDGIAQAEHFLETIFPMVQATGGRMIPPTMDLETYDGVSVATRVPRVTAWLDFVRANLAKPMVYSSQGLWQGLTNNMLLNNAYGWAAAWTSAATFTAALRPFGWPEESVIVWQNGVYPTHSWIQPVPGITGAIDHNYYLGPLTSLRALVGLDQTDPGPAPIPCQPLPRARVWASSLRIRSAPSTGGAIAGLLGTGDIVTIYGIHRGWAMIDPVNPRWVYDYYLDRVTS